MNYSKTPPVPQESPCLKAALEYVALGWHVLPLYGLYNGVCLCVKGKACGTNAGKHPRLHNGHNGATIDAKRVRTWKWASANVGIATGALSGLLIIDLDPRNGSKETFAALKEKLGPLPTTGPYVATGGGGHHLYFRHPGGYVKSDTYAPGVDIKADGGLVVAPPSLHFSGNRYRWGQPPTSPLAELPPAWREWLSVTQTTDVTQTTQTSQDGSGPPKDTRSQASRQAATPLSAGDFIQEAIERTLPARQGERHHAVFHFARILRGHEAYRNMPVGMLRPYVDAWYDRAVARLGAGIKASADENWWDFSEGWGEVRYAGEGGFMAAVIERARSAELPQAALQYRSEEARLLVSLCRELQREAGDKPFFLATTTLAEIFNLGDNRMSAWRWLDGLCRDGVLRLVKKGDPGKREASSFRYLGD